MKAGSSVASISTPARRSPARMTRTIAACGLASMIGVGLADGHRRQGQHVQLGIAVRIGDLRQHDRRVPVADRDGDDVADLEALDPSGPAPEPASLPDPGGEDRLQPRGVGRRQQPGEVGLDREEWQIVEAAGADIGRLVLRGLEHEPHERVGAHRQDIARVADRREFDPAHELDRDVTGELREIELDGLDEPGQVRDDQERLALVAPDQGQDLVVLRVEELEASPAERRDAASAGR